MLCGRQERDVCTDGRDTQCPDLRIAAWLQRISYDRHEGWYFLEYSREEFEGLGWLLFNLQLLSAECSVVIDQGWQRQLGWCRGRSLLVLVGMVVGE